MKDYKLLLAAGKDDPIFPSPFYSRFSGEYILRKLLPNLTFNKMGKGKISSDCLEFKKRQVRDFTQNIVDIVLFPTILPEIIDEPGDYLPDNLPEHDVLIAAGVHPDIFPELLKRAAEAGCKALIAPREDPKWIDKYLEKTLKNICEKYGIEYAFPKPFCSLKKTGFHYIDNFLKEFKLGRPEYEVQVDDKGYITNVNVIRSAPCGATYYVACGLIGKKIGEEAVEEANKLWHAYACIASNAIDEEIKDSIMHIAAHINLQVAENTLKI
ncbi:MAG: DUF166 domain-containing protein [Thermovenabulum sp.]|uniref:DUF166 domain-containing protein n=1 Tax=Thermovenabulum sp. TaxID=3100335 RepID=UPI003C7A5606